MAERGFYAPMKVLCQPRNENVKSLSVCPESEQQIAVRRRDRLLEFRDLPGKVSSGREDGQAGGVQKVGHGGVGRLSSEDEQKGRRMWVFSLGGKYEHSSTGQCVHFARKDSSRSRETSFLTPLTSYPSKNSYSFNRA